MREDTMTKVMAAIAVAWEPGPDDEPCTCSVCGDSYILNEGCDPGPYCDSCAQAYAIKFAALIVKLTAVKARKSQKPDRRKEPRPQPRRRDDKRAALLRERQRR